MTREEKARVRETLEQLDHDDDEFWTEQGNPRIHAVGTLAGVQLTRDQLVAIAPEFSRHNPKLPWVKEGEEHADAKDEEAENDGQEAEANVEVEAQESVLTEKEEIDDLNKQIKEADDEISKLERGVAFAQAELAQARRDRDQLVVQTPEKTDPQKTQKDIRAYLMSRLSIQHGSAKRRQEFAREYGLEPKDLANVAGSRLDQSMKGKRGRGLNRPTRSPLSK